MQILYTIIVTPTRNLPQNIFQSSRGVAEAAVWACVFEWTYTRCMRTHLWFTFNAVSLSDSWHANACVSSFICRVLRWNEQAEDANCQICHSPTTRMYCVWSASSMKSTLTCGAVEVPLTYRYSTVPFKQHVVTPGYKKAEKKPRTL